MMAPRSAHRPVARLRAARVASGAALCLVVIAASSCDAEGKAGRKIAGTYLRTDAPSRSTTALHEVLTLRKDGRWHRNIRVVMDGAERANASDSGMFFVRGVTLTLRSVVSPGGVPTRYTIAGDSLFQANAAAVHALTGYDIGENILVRQRQAADRP